MFQPTLFERINLSRRLAIVLLAVFALGTGLAQDAVEREGYFEVRSATTESIDGVHTLDARLQLVLSSEGLAALESGEIGAAAVDVLPKEPPVDGDPLLDYDGPNLMVTPHIAWGSNEARQAAIDELVANVAAFLEGTERNRVV